jgi:hypothetical protein
MRKFVVAMQVLGTPAVLFLAGCGGGGSPGKTTGASAATGSSFVSQADFICRTRNDANVVASQRILSSPAAAAAFTTEVAAAYQKEIAGLKALHPPASAKDPFAAFIADEQSILNSVHMATQAAQKSDVTGFQAAHGQALATEIDSLPKASAAGLTICAQKLPASDQSAIKKLAIEGSVNPTPDLCVHSVTHHLLLTNFGGSVTKCEEQIATQKATSAQVTHLYGILPSATVLLTQQGASPSKVLLGLLKEKGTWRVDSAGPQP